MSFIRFNGKGKFQALGNNLILYLVAMDYFDPGQDQRLIFLNPPSKLSIPLCDKIIKIFHTCFPVGLLHLGLLAEQSSSESAAASSALLASSFFFFL